MKHKMKLCMLMAVCALLCSCRPAENKAKPKAQFRLTYNIFFPASHGAAKLGKLWAEEVEKRTNGAVVVDVYPGSVLTTDSENFNGVVFGSTDVGMSCFAYSRGLFPLIEVVGLSERDVGDAYRQRLHPAFSAGGTVGCRIDVRPCARAGRAGQQPARPQV